MAKFEYEFSEQDRQLTISEGVATFGDNPYDYIRLTIYPSEAIDDIVDLPDDAQGIDGQAIFYSSISTDSFEINLSPFTDSLDELRTKFIGETISENGNDFKIYKNPNNDIYIKPNEIFNTFGLPQGSYSIQIDFLNQISPPFDETHFDDTGGEILPATGDNAHYQFIIKQISTSRKEVRLKLLDKNIVNNSSTILNLTQEFNDNQPEFLNEFDDDGNQIPNPSYKYQFKHILNLGTGDHNPIMNYQFDRVSDGRNNQSIILKLYDELPPNITNLTMVSIEREVITTQIQSVTYFSDVAPVYFGDGLQPDISENWINPTNNEIGFENYDELSGSIDNITLDNLVSESLYNYPNLNTDFTEFKNHTFFGSAKIKLENFKNKIETIQGHYSEISNSLHMSGVNVDGDSSVVIQKRKNLFIKINDEIKTFTPYERFLYYDGQSESSASAPGLGKNYADIVPVRDGVLGDYEGALNGADGFNVVYHHSSKNVGGSPNGKYIDLFSNKYNVQDKPFFNYSGSLFLSFLMKGDSGSAITWENRNVNSNNSLGAPLPHEALHQTEISNPNITSSKYQRYVFKASQSYWTPEFVLDNDVASITTWSGSSEYNILSTNTKTGSVQIKDSTGLYPTTVVSSSAGIKFKGSIMPAGELFRIFIISDLSSSLSGSWNLDSQTSGAAVTNAMLTDFSGRGNSGSIEGTPTVSDGVSIHNSTYGNSFLFQSESNEGVRFFSDTDFNYGREDNFSLSVWAKRFHPDTGSADSAGKTAQPIFTRGFGAESYGIDYDFVNNQLRAGVRPDAQGPIQASFTVTDDLLEWNHIVFTFESGSSTGIKLYLNGELKDTESTTGTAYRITGSEDFTSSAATMNTSEDALSIGSNDVIGGTAGFYNGFIQYPRVYNKAITSAEVQELYQKPDGILDTKITDVKVTLVNPTDVLPFDNLYHTSSANWNNWYNGTYDSASAFDDENIHSLENNLPLYIQESSDYNEMKDFLNLQGEQYDLIKNHIDSMGTLHNRGYKKTNSPPENTYPILLNNMGWEAINPFSGSLTDSLGSYLTGVTSIDDIKNNTWRKTLNNLLYIYKSKGTQNSVRALLNTYGYPPDVIGFQEFGGGSQDLETLDDYDGSFPLDLESKSGSFGYNVVPKILHRYMFQNKPERILNLDWWMDSADLETVEFVYKHKQTNNDEKILKSSGSGAETLWDLRLIPSASTADVVFSRFQFRLNNSNTGSLAIADNAVSMSTIDLEVRDGELWNVMLQRMTSSISGAGTQEYKLHAALQDGAQIKTFNSVSMSVSGGLETFATASFTFIESASNNDKITFTSTDGTTKTYMALSSSVNGALSASNLVLFATGSGTTKGAGSSSAAGNLIAAITSSNGHGNKFSVNQPFEALGIISFTQNVGGPKGNTVISVGLGELTSSTNPNPPTSFVGGSTDSNHFANRNWQSSGSRHYLDSSNLFVGETVSGSLAEIKGWKTALSSSSFRKHVFNKFSTVGNSIESSDTELVYHFKLNENYSSGSVTSSNHLLTIVDAAPKCSVLLTTDYSFQKSGSLFTGSAVYGTDIIQVLTFGFHDNIIGDYSVNDNNVLVIDDNPVIGNLNPHSSAIESLTRPMGKKPKIVTSLKLEINRSPQDAVNNFILNNLDGFNFEDYYGNPISYYSQSYDEFDTLRKDFFKCFPVKVDVNTFIRAHEDMFNHSLSEGLKALVPGRSTFSDINSNAGVTIKPTILEKQKYENERHSVEPNPNTTTGSLGVISIESVMTGSILISPMSGSISVLTAESVMSGSKLELPYSASIKISDSGSLGNPYNGVAYTSLTSSIINPYSASMTASPSLTGSGIVTSKDGTIDYALTANESYTSVHKNWGTSSADVQHINFAAPAGSYGTFNTYDIDTRFVFHMIGDTEIYSGSRYNGSFDYTDFSNPHRLHNRVILSNDIHSGVTYESFITGSPGGQTGRMMGKTRYFTTSSTGEIILPRNHISKFSQPFKEQMINGTQNINPGQLNVRYDDYSTASFYRVKVTGGEREIVIRNSGQSSLDSDDKIIY